MASIIGYVLGKTIAERQGLDESAASKYAVLGAIGGASPMSILAVDIGAKREAEQQQQQQLEQQQQQQADPGSSSVSVPNVLNESLAEAQQDVEKVGLFATVSAESGVDLVVKRQAPDAHTAVPAGSEVQLVVGPKATGGSSDPRAVENNNTRNPE